MLCLGARPRYNLIADDGVRKKKQLSNSSKFVYALSIAVFKMLDLYQLWNFDIVQTVKFYLPRYARLNEVIQSRV